MVVNLQQTGGYDEDAMERAMAHLVTEDGTPVDNRFSERQQHLLPEILFASWPVGKPFEAVSNVGLFTSITEQAIVPDFMHSLNVQPRPVTSKKADRSYMTWIYGKPPDLVVEVVSNTKGGELGRKKTAYARAGITYYVVFDPFLKLGKRDRKRELRTFVLTEGRYIEATSAHWLPGIGLGLAVWKGWVGDVEDRWLRFIDVNGNFLPTSQELVQQARTQADEETRRADHASRRASEESKRADQECQRAESESKRAESESKRAESESKRADDASKRADDESRRAERAERELAQLQAELDSLRRHMS